MMAATVLLAAIRQPTGADIDDVMAGNLCRCGTYQRIRRAVHHAAAPMAGGNEISACVCDHHGSDVVVVSGGADGAAARGGGAINRTPVGGGFGRRLVPDFIVHAVLASKAVGSP